MTASPETTIKNDKRIFAFLSLGFLLAALLIPIPIIAAFGPLVFPTAFGVVADLLALLFGALSWSDQIGRTVARLSVLVLIVGGTVLMDEHRRAHEAPAATVAPAPPRQE